MHLLAMERFGRTNAGVEGWRSCTALQTNPGGETASGVQEENPNPTRSRAAHTAPFLTPTLALQEGRKGGKGEKKAGLDPFLTHSMCLGCRQMLFRQAGSVGGRARRPWLYSL